jgi:WD40 repeat protein
MSSPLESMVRSAVHDLADGADPRPRPALVRGAVRRGQRLRRRRRASLVASVGLVTLLALLIPYGLSASRTATPQPGGPPSPSPDARSSEPVELVELVDGWIVLGNRKIWNRHQGRYVDGIDGDLDITVSPNGDWAARAATGSGNSLFNVVDLRTGALSRYQVTPPVMAPQWSPDGNRLLFTVIPKTASTLVVDMVIIDVTTGATSTQRLLNTAGQACVIACVLTWLPGGDEVALLLGRNMGETRPEEVDGLQLYTLDGRPSRTLPVKGVPGGAQAWSPDGRYVVVQGSGQGYQTQLVEVSTGALVRPFDGDPMQVSWVDNDRLLVWATPPGPAAPSRVTLTDIAGQLSQSWNVSSEIVGTTRSPAPVVLMAHLG